MNDSLTPKIPISPYRPRGIWIITILNVLISGIFPILTAIAFLFIESNPLSSLDIYPALLQGGLGIAIIWVSIGAWQGKERFRKRLLVLLIVFHTLQIVSDLIILLIGGVPAQFISRFAGAIVRSIFWIWVNLWYFRRYQTLEWYKAMEIAQKSR